MKSITDHIREHILGRANYIIDKLPDIPHMRGILFVDFIIYMARRMILGQFRYGNFLKTNQPKWNRIESIEQRLKEYKKSFNKEHLIDISNLCMIEFYKCKNSKCHFKSLDDNDDIHVKIHS